MSCRREHGPEISATWREVSRCLQLCTRYRTWSPLGSTPGAATSLAVKVTHTKSFACPQTFARSLSRPWRLHRQTPSMKTNHDMHPSCHILDLGCSITFLAAHIASPYCYRNMDVIHVGDIRGTNSAVRRANSSPRRERPESPPIRISTLKSPGLLALV